MTGRRPTTTARAAAAGATLTILLAVAGVRAGDEDISPNAYQEFDPVTGYMITVDPDAENQQDHAAADAQNAATSGHGAGEPPPGNGASRAWLYGLVAALAGAGFIVWVRSKARGNGPL